MTTFAVSIEDKKFGSFLDVLKNLEYATVIKLDGKKVRPEFIQFLNDTRNALKDAKLAREGKIKLQTLDSFLQELREEDEAEENMRKKIVQTSKAS